MPACTAKGVDPASTMREKHARSSAPASRIADINPETRHGDPASTICEKHATGSAPACSLADINPETPAAVCLDMSRIKKAKKKHTNKCVRSRLPQAIWPSTRENIVASLFPFFLPRVPWTRWILLSKATTRANMVVCRIWLILATFPR